MFIKDKKVSEMTDKQLQENVKAMKEIINQRLDKIDKPAMKKYGLYTHTGTQRNKLICHTIVTADSLAEAKEAMADMYIARESNSVKFTSDMILLPTDMPVYTNENVIHFQL